MAPSDNLYNVHLHAGTNTLSFDNPTNFAPDLDRIVIAPTIADDLFKNFQP